MALLEGDEELLGRGNYVIGSEGRCRETGFIVVVP